MVKRLILVAGNIGSGKTSLTERIGERLGWKTAYESVADNPYLADYYVNMKAWSFHLQVFFLGHRAQQHLDMWNSGGSSIIDRSIYEDAFVFARALHQLGNLNERDHKTYQKIFDMVVNGLPPPSLLVYLKAPVSVLMERIHSRGRDIEKGVTAEFLSLLESYYEDWIKNFDICPVLTLRTDNLDFVHIPKHMDTVVKRIKDKLAGKEEIIFEKNGAKD